MAVIRTTNVSLGGSDQGIADTITTAGLQLGYDAVAHLASSREGATSIVLTTKERVLDTWKHIQEAEAKEDVLLGKIQENPDKMDAMISAACIIQRSIKEN